jgi:predicted MPP superfamily phosphohydrolase
MEHELAIPGLPSELVGFRIAQVSDLHVGESIGRKRVEEVVAGVNALEPDLVAITGDLVDGRPEELAAHVAPFLNLRARHGTFFVTGNHEYYSGAEAWCRHFSGLGMRVLDNEHVLLDHDGAQVAVVGVPDPAVKMMKTGEAPSLSKALAGVPDSAFRLLLAHQPRIAKESASLGVQLQLSGHTHGGQFFPFTLFVGLFQPYVAGLYRIRDMWLHVSRGTGHWGPPMRLASPQEISLLKLVV